MGDICHQRDVIRNTSRDIEHQCCVPHFHNSSSHFTISPRDAGKLVYSQKKREDERNCFLLQISFYPVYSDAEIPNSCFKKLPRIVNGIPLGAGMLVNEQIGNIRWKYVEGGKKMHTFISKPICEEEAEESKRAIKDSFARHSQILFGDITVKATIILSRCINFDDDFIINDIATTLNEGLHFSD